MKWVHWLFCRLIFKLRVNTLHNFKKCYSQEKKLMGLHFKLQINKCTDSYLSLSMFHQKTEPCRNYLVWWLRPFCTHIYLPSPLEYLQETPCFLPSLPRWNKKTLFYNDGYQYVWYQHRQTLWLAVILQSKYAWVTSPLIITSQLHFTVSSIQFHSK